MILAGANKIENDDCIETISIRRNYIGGERLIIIIIITLYLVGDRLANAKKAEGIFKAFVSELKFDKQAIKFEVH